MSPRRLAAWATAGSAVVVLGFATLSGAAAAEPRAAARSVVVTHSLAAPAARPIEATAVAARPAVFAVPQAVKPSPSASPKRTATTAVVPAPAPRVPNRFVIYAVYLLALVVVGLVVLWAAVGWHERPPRIDPREPA